MGLPRVTIGDVYWNTAGWETLTSLVDVENRMAGSPGEAEAMEILAETFHECGLREVDTDWFETPVWQRGTTALSLPDRGSRYDDTHQLLALPGSPPVEVATDLVDVGHGTPEEFEEVADDLLTPITVREELAPHSDHWPFVRRGVPGVMAYSVGDSDDRGWGHTHGDTLDKVEWRDLRELAIPLAAAVLKLARGDRTAEHVAAEEIERRAEAEGRNIS